MRYAAVISYFGARYVGWQRQLNGLSVQEVLEKAMSKAFGAEVSATASGRTDAGVHALAQVVHFDAETSIPLDKIPFAVNSYLPNDVSMLSCEIAPEDFNARFSAKRKTYCYKLYLSKHKRPMLSATHEHIVVPLNYAAMRAGADEIEGEHDFKCFEATGSIIKNTVRTVYKIDIDVKPLDTPTRVFGESNFCGESDSEISAACESCDDLKAPENGNNTENSREFEQADSSQAPDLQGRDVAENENMLFDCVVEISVTGNGFLYNMVRIIAGTLVYCGMGKLNADGIKQAIESGNRTLAGKTLPAHGLHLICVKYK